MGDPRWLALQVRRLFWLRGEPDPRLLQLGFVLLIGLSTLAMVPVDGWATVSAPERAALLLCLLTAAVTWVVTPALVSPSRTLQALAFADLAVIGVSSLQHDVGTLPFVVLPALWLGRQLRWRAVPIAGVATFVLVSLPALVVHGDSDGTVSQMVPLPLIAVVAVLSIVVGLDAAASAQADAERALAELARQRRSSEAIVDAVDVGLLLVNRDGRVRQANRRQADFDRLGYPEGRCAEGWIFGADGRVRLEPGEVPAAVAARGNDFDDQRVWIGREPASRRALSVSARALRDETGRRTGSVLASKDVTDLVRALAVKGEFISLVSHELRTPLTSIYGYVSILQERDDLSDTVRRQLEVVARSAERLRVLVDDLLDAAQSGTTGITLERTPVDLARVVAESVAAARPRADEAGVRLQEGPPCVASLQGDPGRLAQVVDNLLSNAIKYTPAGGTVSVELGVTRDSVELRVCDDGMGISADDLTHVFTRFFRTRQATDLAIRGVGLGLSISQQIVEQHGGVIEVRSEVGRGSEFRVVLPGHH